MPLVGNVLQFGKLPTMITKWHKTYGDTMSCYIGSRLIVIMHNIDTAKKVFMEEVSTGRDHKFTVKLLTGKGMLNHCRLNFEYVYFHVNQQIIIKF